MYRQDINELTISGHVNEAPSPTQPTLLIATVNEARRRFLAAQLDADGYTVHEADHLAAVVAKLSVHAIDVLLLGDLEHPADCPTLLRAIRAGQRPLLAPLVADLAAWRHPVLSARARGLPEQGGPPAPTIERSVGPSARHHGRPLSNHQPSERPCKRRQHRGASHRHDSG